ncbi:glucose 1-dehydrogenase [Herbiconiux sp. VKM Ac-1786]|uniref:SDR family NAD(P)-dependent oxidoreductase n=1 Tax=Herbiconiux sp. VKM Ac-1786 TaxID=2783824 RepID=UPI00188B6266|nr:glucose 1-dehydrogenase [Herbiconiux sp. VKM Ac-1786]MBF4572580.1 glucose 1-dehydrogenase [Herbiconiux sp. VKM Ac-1786]
MANRVSDTVAVVTGAGSGMGRGIARALALEGASVVIADLNGEAAEATAQALRDEGFAAAGVRADVSKRDEVRRVVERTVAEFGRLDVWFNNAGFNAPMKFLDVTEENWRSIMEVNALGVLIGTQEAARQMIAQGGGGKIVNTTSMAGRQGFPAFAPYSAAKAAVISLTQSAAKALAEHDITVNAFAPGVVDTPLWVKLDEDLLAIGETKTAGGAMDEFAAGIIRGRTATVDDIVGTALYLASSDSDYLTAQVIMIDGGMVLV